MENKDSRNQSNNTSNLQYKRRYERRCSVTRYNLQVDEYTEKMVSYQRITKTLKDKNKLYTIEDSDGDRKVWIIMRQVCI